MITLPRRSVTRFFIPLIDVLILLFCIFLLMPFVSGPTTPEPLETKTPPKEPPPENVTELQKQLTEAKARIERMEKAAQAGLADRLVIRALEVRKDEKGLLFLRCYDPNERRIYNETQALQLIAHQKTVASKAGGVKDVMFLILIPRDEKGNELGYPSKPDAARIRGWFGDVPLKFQ